MIAEHLKSVARHPTMRTYPSGSRTGLPPGGPCIADDDEVVEESVIRRRIASGG